MCVNVNIREEDSLRKMLDFAKTIHYILHFLCSHKIPLIYIKYSEYCGNIGNGVYNGHIWKDYHWLKGRFLYTYSKSNNYSLRYYIKTPVEEVKKHGLIIIKRHAL